MFSFLFLLIAVTAQSYKITRDPYGVPTIDAQTDEDAFQGLGYAMAEDRLGQMYLQSWKMRGTLASYFGPGEKDANVARDKNARLRQYAAWAARAVEKAPAELQLYLSSFTKGINDYVATKPSVELFDKHDITIRELPAWTQADVVLAYTSLGVWFFPDATNKAKKLVDLEARAAEIGWKNATEEVLHDQDRPCDDSAAIVQEDKVPTEYKNALADLARKHDFTGPYCRPFSKRRRLQLQQQQQQEEGEEEGEVGGADLLDYFLEEEEEDEADRRRRRKRDYEEELEFKPKFSHAWAVGKKITASGKSILHGDPQIPISVPSVFYEAHVRGASFEVHGGFMVGSIGAIVASTRHVAWSVTASGFALGDLFRLDIDPQDQDKYVVDGRPVPFTNLREEVIAVKGRNPVSVFTRSSIFGPDISELVDNAPGVWALQQFPLASDDVPFAGFVDMYRAESATAFQKGAFNFTFPTCNLLFADQEGKVGYRLQGTFPLRSRHMPTRGWTATFGNESKYEWEGTVPAELNPTVIDHEGGYILSANHMPMASWYPIKLSWNGPLGDTSRARRIRERLSALTPGTATKEDIISVHKDSVLGTPRSLVRAAVYMRERGTEMGTNAANALAILEPWVAEGASARDASLATALIKNSNYGYFRSNAGALSTNAMYGSGPNGAATWLKHAVDAVVEEGVADIDELSINFIIHLLGDGYLSTVGKLGNESSSWVQSINQSLYTYEYDLFYEELGKFDGKMGISRGPYYLPVPQSETILSQSGQCFSINVDFADARGGGVDTVNPLGQNEKSTSSHFDDQSALWREEKFKFTKWLPTSGSNTTASPDTTTARPGTTTARPGPGTTTARPGGSTTVPSCGGTTTTQPPRTTTEEGPEASGVGRFLCKFSIIAPAILLPSLVVW